MPNKHIAQPKLLTHFKKIILINFAYLFDFFAFAFNTLFTKFKLFFLSLRNQNTETTPACSFGEFIKVNLTANNL